MKEQVKQMQKAKFRFTKDNWKKPTPAMWRKLGEAINTICIGISVSVYNDIPWVAATVFFGGLLCRALVEFFIDGD